jgi:hypothetical protein
MKSTFSTNFGISPMSRLMPLSTLALFFAVSPLMAAEVGVSAAPTGGADLTVYGNDLALVRERRTFRLPAANAQLAFSGVSSRMQPETAFLDVLKGDAVKVTEQIFNFDVITPASLLARSVGKDVSVISINEATGKETVERARIISATNGVVLDIGGKIHTTVPGRIVYDSLPAGLRPTPTLLMTVTGGEGKDAEAEFSYLTGGLSWHADYVAQYDPEAGRMDLNVWATITNTTGMDFRDARIKLVAGDVNRAAPPPAERFQTMAKQDMAMAAAAPMAEGVSTQAMVASHIYAIAKPTTVADKESKQLALLSGQGIAVKREINIRSQPHFFTMSMRGQPVQSRAEVELIFKNDGAAKLGVPLPAGTMRVYGLDQQGAPQFLGEDAVGHTAEGGDVRVKLGDDFDIPVTREQLNFVRASDTITLSVWRITVKNAKSRPVKVQVIEPLPGAWEITKESHPRTKSNASTAQWTLEVPAKGQTVLEYNVKSQF